MVVGFLVSVVEAWPRPDGAHTKATRAGFWQMALLFLGGFTLMLGVLLDAVPLITLNLPFEIIAVGIFLRRNWAAPRSVGWGEGRPPPFLAASAVAVVARSAERAAEGAAAVQALVPGATVESGVADLGDLSTIWIFAETHRIEHDAVDLLINNAGVMATPFGRTADGFETQFGTNHLGHLLTLTRVRSTRSSRTSGR